MSYRVRLLVALLWTAAVIAGLTLPSEAVPETDIRNVDKIAHLLLFFVFGFLWMWALGMDISRRTATVFLTGLFFAVGTEVLQGLLPGARSPDILDAVADVIGLVVGIGGYLAVRRRMRTHAV